MVMAAHARMPSNGFNYFRRVGVNRTDRPHLFFGDHERPRNELPHVGPSLTGTAFALLEPRKGAVTVESDREVLQKLLEGIPVGISVGDAYVGEVNEQGIPHGQGNMKYADGRNFTGGFQHGRFHGDGCILVYSNGTRYEGGFREGVRHGKVPCTQLSLSG